ncbi:hypothetical protein PCANC_21926 [Puccinia coronata f. sp. avenae]|uniref:Uncharacterized protein n=1 Tax=Puccinia coronata f. sp. avenae TaxID=200324 RepID=A0A2N5TSR3_9BASI|nr:hypothetical protein PCANC_21926 [Puccinia coronata f. sp. avenae]
MTRRLTATNPVVEIPGLPVDVPRTENRPVTAPRRPSSDSGLVLFPDRGGGETRSPDPLSCRTPHANQSIQPVLPSITCSH